MGCRAKAIPCGPRVFSFLLWAVVRACSTQATTASVVTVRLFPRAFVALTEQV